MSALGGSDENPAANEAAIASEPARAHVTDGRAERTSQNAEQSSATHDGPSAGVAMPNSTGYAAVPDAASVAGRWRGRSPGSNSSTHTHTHTHSRTQSRSSSPTSTRSRSASRSGSESSTSRSSSRGSSASSRSSSHSSASSSRSSASSHTHTHSRSGSGASSRSSRSSGSSSSSTFASFISGGIRSVFSDLPFDLGFEWNTTGASPFVQGFTLAPVSLDEHVHAHNGHGIPLPIPMPSLYPFGSGAEQDEPSPSVPGVGAVPAGVHAHPQPSPPGLSRAPGFLSPQGNVQLGSTAWLASSSAEGAPQRSRPNSPSGAAQSQLLWHTPRDPADTALPELLTSLPSNHGSAAASVISGSRGVAHGSTTISAHGRRGAGKGPMLALLRPVNLFAPSASTAATSDGIGAASAAFAETSMASSLQHMPAAGGLAVPLSRTGRRGSGTHLVPAALPIGGPNSTALTLAVLPVRRGRGGRKKGKRRSSKARERSSREHTHDRTRERRPKSRHTTSSQTTATGSMEAGAVLPSRKRSRSSALGLPSTASGAPGDGGVARDGSVGDAVTAQLEEGTHRPGSSSGKRSARRESPSQVFRIKHTTSSGRSKSSAFKLNADEWSFLAAACASVDANVANAARVVTLHQQYLELRFSLAMAAQARLAHGQRALAELLRACKTGAEVHNQAIDQLRVLLALRATPQSAAPAAAAPSTATGAPTATTTTPADARWSSYVAALRANSSAPLRSIAFAGSAPPSVMPHVQAHHSSAAGDMPPSTLGQTRATAPQGGHTAAPRAVRDSSAPDSMTLLAAAAALSAPLADPQTGQHQMHPDAARQAVSEAGSSGSEDSDSNSDSEPRERHVHFATTGLPDFYHDFGSSRSGSGDGARRKRRRRASHYTDRALLLRRKRKKELQEATAFLARAAATDSLARAAFTAGAPPPPMPPPAM